MTNKEKYTLNKARHENGLDAFFMLSKKIYNQLDDLRDTNKEEYFRLLRDYIQIQEGMSLIAKNISVIERIIKSMDKNGDMYPTISPEEDILPLKIVGYYRKYKKDLEPFLEK